MPLRESDRGCDARRSRSLGLVKELSRQLQLRFDAQSPTDPECLINRAQDASKKGSRAGSPYAFGVDLKDTQVPLLTRLQGEFNPARTDSCL